MKQFIFSDSPEKEGRLLNEDGEEYESVDLSINGI
jgi:hypothetical protein